MIDKNVQKKISLPKVSLDQAVGTFAITVIGYIALAFRLGIASDDPDGSLYNLHLQYNQHHAHVVQLIDYAEGSGLLPPGQYFDLTHGDLQDVEREVSLERPATVEKVNDDEEAYQKLEGVIEDIHTTVTADGDFDEKYSYGLLRDSLVASRDKIVLLHDQYNAEAIRFNNIEDGLLYRLHFWIDPMPLLDPIEVKPTTSK